jgi:hypothetical protein
MIAGLVCLALAAALIAVVAATPSSVRSADHQWLRWMLDIRAPPGVFVAKVLNVLAGGTVIWIVRAAIAAALAIWRRWPAARDWLGSTVVRRAGPQPAHAPPPSHRLPRP